MNRGVPRLDDPDRPFVCRTGRFGVRYVQGSITVAGVDYNISGWIKESQKTGEKFLSLRVESKDTYKSRGGGLKKAEPKPQRMMTEDNWSDLEEPF